MKLRLAPLAVTAAFLLPFLLAWWLNFGPSPWQPEAAHNRGTLIQPPVLVEAAGVRSLAGDSQQEELAPDVFQGQWSLVYAGMSECVQACEAALVNMRQSWLALGKDARRVQRWFLVTDGGPPAESLLAEHPGLKVIAPNSPSSGTSSGTLGAALEIAGVTAGVTAGASAEALARESSGGGPAGESAGEMIWMLDPGGFVILSYGPSATAMDILEDMERLLKYSGQDR